MTKTIKYLFSPRSIPIILCTSLMLFFLGFYFLIAIKSGSFVESLKNETNILIEMNVDASPGMNNAMQNYIKELPGVVQSTLSFVSKAEASQLMKEEMGESFLEIADKNPFFDVFQFSYDNKLGDPSALLTEIKKRPEVHNAYTKTSATAEISRNVRRFSRLALIIGIFFSFLAITLIYNAIRLSLVESKSAFYTLKLLGSDWNFIKRPFLQRAFYSGLLSGIIAIVLFVIGVSSLRFSNDIFSKFISMGNILTISLILLLVGFFVNLLSTNAVLNRFLGLKEEDLYR